MFEPRRLPGGTVKRNGAGEAARWFGGSQPASRGPESLLVGADRPTLSPSVLGGLSSRLPASTGLGGHVPQGGAPVLPKNLPESLPFPMPSVPALHSPNLWSPSPTASSLALS